MKYLYLIIGFLFVGLGVIGAFLPILPTVPFLLVALYCFSKSSEKVHQWFIATQLYQRHLASFYEERAMTLKTKWAILLFASSGMALAFYFSPSMIAKIIITLLVVVKYYVFFAVIKTIPAAQKTS